MRSRFLKAAVTLCSVPTAYVGYLSILAFHNRLIERQIVSDLQEIKDTTRPDYEFFGINWGASADQGIMDELDTGDLLFATVECRKMVSVSEILTCEYERLKRLEWERQVDVMAVLVRTPENLHVVLSGVGPVRTQTYPEFLQNRHQK